MDESTELEKIFRPLNEAERKFAPSALYVKGDVSLLAKGTRVSIIGSRDSSKEGLARTRKLVKSLVSQGVIIVSGLAKGIDTAAHQTAIDEGGKTIAVLGTPLSQVSPVENRALQNLIGKDHLLISQFQEGKPVSKGNFPMRNRLMALISDATIIMEAKDGSGTTHQGWEALRLARPLWIPKSMADNAELKWPKEFLHYGAEILSDDTLEDLEEDLREGGAAMNESLSF